MLYKVSIKFLSKGFSGALTYVQFILKMHSAADVTLVLCQVMGMRAAMKNRHCQGPEAKGRQGIDLRQLSESREGWTRTKSWVLL